MFNEKIIIAITDLGDKFMLKISMEYRKRILFCRLKGSLNKNTSPKLIEYIEPIIEKNRIRYVVLNIGELLDIDEVGNETLLRVKKNIKLNKGKVLILNNNNNLLNTKLVALDILNING